MTVLYAVSVVFHHYKWSFPFSETSNITFQTLRILFDWGNWGNDGFSDDHMEVLKFDEYILNKSKTELHSDYTLSNTVKTNAFRWHSVELDKTWSDWMWFLWDLPYFITLWHKLNFPNKKNVLKVRHLDGKTHQFPSLTCGNFLNELSWLKRSNRQNIRWQLSWRLKWLFNRKTSHVSKQHFSNREQLSG